MTDLADRILQIPRRLIRDERGWFLKVIDGHEDQLPNYTGEIYFTCAVPGQEKGGHYHEKAIEWFSPVVGTAILRLEDVDSGERMEIVLDAGYPQTVVIPTRVAHVVVNNGDADFILCAYTDQLYKPEDTIAFTFK